MDVSVCRAVPEQIDGAKQGCRTPGWEKAHFPSLGPFFDQARFVESPRVFGGCRDLHSALVCDLLDAEITPLLKKSDHFDPAVVCQSAGQLCPPSVSVCHGVFLPRFYFLPKVKTWGVAGV
jgi:hypothetical protein